jgi:hypothetical protein
MSDAKNFLDDARKSFRLASDSTEAKSVEHYAEIGHDYLQLAHDAAKQVVPKSPPSWWGPA